MTAWISKVFRIAVYVMAVVGVMLTTLAVVIISGAKQVSTIPVCIHQGRDGVKSDFDSKSCREWMKKEISKRENK
jgi:hypothetical protein